MKKGKRKKNVLAVGSMPDRRSITVKDYAAEHGLNRKTVYGAVERGELPAIRVGRSIRILPAALARKAPNETRA